MMVNRDSMIALAADPDDPDDFDVSFEGVEFALREREARRREPQASATKQQITLRLDLDVVAKFRATGPGWQARINAALKAARV